MIALALLAAATSMAGPNAGTAPDADEKLVCRSIHELGSRIPKRICRTAADWDQISRETEEELRRQGRLRSGSPDGN